MDSSLHVPTLLFVTIVASVVVAGGLFVVAASHRREGLGLWATGLLLHAAAYALLACRGRVSDLLSVVLANMLVAGVFSCLLGSLYQFLGRPLPWGRMLVPVLVTGVLFMLFLDDYRARLVMIGILFPLQLALPLYTLWHSGIFGNGRGAWLVFGGLLLEVLLLAARAVMAALDLMPATGMMEGGIMQHLIFLVAFATVQSSSFGFVLMAMDRAAAANRRLAAQDPLTGVPNRRTTIAMLEQGLAQAVRGGQPLALLMVDVDHFKSINDGLGHLAGDKVLCSVVDVLCGRLRSQDFIGRYGGEEFLVLLPGTPLAGAMELARQLCVAVEQAHFEFQGRELPVTISVGVVSCRVRPGERWEGLIDCADAAMYRAKRDGRNRAVAADCATGRASGLAPL